MQDIRVEKIKMIQNRLNNRTRKRLDLERLQRCLINSYLVLQFVLESANN